MAFAMTNFLRPQSGVITGLEDLFVVRNGEVHLSDKGFSISSKKNPTALIIYLSRSSLFPSLCSRNIISYQIFLVR